MTKEAIGKSTYKPFKVGNRDMEISHLQFADDALFFGDWSTGNAFVLIHLLKNFEVASRLQINLRKSWIIGVRISLPKVQRLAKKLHC